jgi:hypothetical protein
LPESWPGAKLAAQNMSKVKFCPDSEEVTMWVVPFKAGQLRERGVVGNGPFEELVGDPVELGPEGEEVNAGAPVVDWGVPVFDGEIPVPEETMAD